MTTNKSSANLLTLNSYWSKKVVFPIFLFTIGMLIFTFIYSFIGASVESQKRTELIVDTLSQLISQPLSTGDNIEVLKRISPIAKENDIGVMVTDLRNELVSIFPSGTSITSVEKGAKRVEKSIKKNGVFIGRVLVFEANRRIPLAKYIAASFVFLSILTFFILYLLQNVKPIIFDISSLSSWIKVGSSSEKRRSFKFEEVDEAYQTILQQSKQALEIERVKASSEIASQVAHDIRSPLSALDLVVGALEDLPEEKRIVIRSALQRIKDIANNLLQNNRVEAEIKSGKDQFQEVKNWLLSDLIESITSEKRTQYRDQLNIEITSKLGENSYGLFAKVNTAELKRVISNLVNNSVEAMKDVEEGWVEIGLTKKDRKYLSLSVKDNGRGISTKVLKRLGEKGVTQGKEGTQSGSGLGVYHAKTVVESWGGQLLIRSKPNQGAEFEIQLPLEEPPSWFVPELEIDKYSTVVVLDDDTSIHDVWKERLKSLKITLLSTSSPESFKLKVKEHSQQASLYLCDYELLGHSDTGLDLIEELQIEKKSVLVTSRFDEEKVRSRFQKLGVRCIPKGLVRLVPIAHKI